MQDLPCKIWGFQGCDCGDCRLLRYRNPIRTSHEAHYVSAAEPNRLRLCKIWGSHGSDWRNIVSWYVTPCGSCKNRHFGGRYRHHQGEKKLTFPARWFFSHGWWRRYVLPKRQFLQELHGITSQKIAFFRMYRVQNSVRRPAILISLSRLFAATPGRGHYGSLNSAICACNQNLSASKQTPWPSVRKRTIPTERPPLVGEI
jgi:hypothetical protein